MAQNGTGAPEGRPVTSVPWGTHIGVLYRNRQELADPVISFVRAALARDACCILVTAPPLNSTGARRVLKKAIPDLESRLASGQLVLQDHHEVYQAAGGFDPAARVNACIAAEERALDQGFDGLFLGGNTAWLGKEDWESFNCVVTALHGVIKNRRIIAMNAYPLRRCGITEIMDIATGHDIVLVNRDGHWKGVGNMPGRRAEAAPCGRDTRIRQIAQTSADIVFTCDAQGVLSFVSHTVEKVLGYPPGDMIGRNVTECILPRFEPDLRDFKARLDEEPDGAWLQTEVRRADGTSAIVEIHASPIMGEDMIAGYEGVCRDITDRVLFRRHVYDQIEKNIEQFAILGDHLRHPLQVIQGWADLMDGEQSDRIRQEVRRINDTVRQLDEGWLESRKIRDFLVKNEPAAESVPRRQKSTRAAGRSRRTTARSRSRAEFSPSQQTLSRYTGEQLVRQAR
ncbi:PAS domain S-box protein [Methanoculleus sp. FWC-SCC1]|uniref:PAS domain S-box protein n=1 Tax=Methanoculleus frigidifontis TaxID=2584085 RepID=A0ABT8MCU0_9EURY|nr:MEDS domain-containing protein [Methanoculleus sp. FWC-SCC1]MDN7025762.1 PAS domain S-box protein [Methanoculleus sp. FWC-SCC1]